MKMIKSMEFEPKGIVEMLNKQKIVPYYISEGVDELLRDFPGQVTRKMAYYMFMLGYIEGKRADRARRKAVRYERQRENI